MKIKIDAAIISQFPDVKIGVLIAENVNNKICCPKIAKIAQQTEESIRKTTTLESLTMLPKINDWREAYRSFGCKPSEYRSSVEALLRRILQGKQLPSINPIVDIYNLISIKYLLPAGGGNLDKIKGDIRLTKAAGIENFVMLGSSTPTPIKSREVVYLDDKEVLCRAWNYRESNTTKITDDIENVYLLLEGLQNTSHQEIALALSELAELISLYCGGAFKKFILNKDNPEASI